MNIKLDMDIGIDVREALDEAIQGALTQTSKASLKTQVMEVRKAVLELFFEDLDTDEPAAD